MDKEVGGADSSDTAELIARYRQQLEDALWGDERSGSLESALAIYGKVAAGLRKLDTSGDDALDRERDIALAYALMREANALRQLDRIEEAARKDDEGVTASRRAGDTLSVGRALLSMGGTAFGGGDSVSGIRYLEEAREAFSSETSTDHIQGLGWYWILLADVGNAGMLDLEPGEVVEAADEALSLLRPIENWPGVARAHGAKASALERMGDLLAAEEQRRLASEVESLE